ncbi:hypothetical protein Sste5346_005246 [Sporothrix stenoceras]|uniref:Chitin-binding type-1 domain-containing protein n=1 Tax=Sporothrix stenoceras TaxID=5173 RepID=A0ABR3Z5T9_9PEZI
MRTPATTVALVAAQLLAFFGPLVTADLPTDSDATVSSIWVVPDATEDAFNLTLVAGDSLQVAWSGTDGLTGDTTADLWVAAYAYSTSDTFSQLLTKNVDLSVDGTFNWTVAIPQPQLDATPHYVLTFKTARDDFQFNASDPGLPSPGISVIENHDDGLAEDSNSSGSVLTSADGSTVFDSGDGDDDDDDDDDGDSDYGDDDDDDDGDGDDYGDSSSSNSTSTASASASPSEALTITTNATCGGSFTCIGSTFGDCCSQHNFCGSTIDYCGAGCLSDFGTCDETTSTGDSGGKPLSVAATAGIASGVSVSVVGLSVVAFFWFRRHRSEAGRRKSQEQQMGGGGNGNYLGDGSSAVFYNGAGRGQKPYLMLETGRNGPMPNNGSPLTPGKSIYTGYTSPDSTHQPEYYNMATIQRPPTSSTTAAGTPHPGSVSTTSIQPPLPHQRTGQQSGVFEMEGGEHPYHYGQTPPAELDGTSTH